jgi:DNA-binding transcriptional LysR family regulator
MNITIRQVEAFYYTAKLGSISLTAERLCITQAAASMALKGFEEQMGEKLFNRVGKKLVLNGKGDAILQAASELIAKAGEISNFFSDKSSLYGHLAIGTIPSIGNYVLPDSISAFVDKNPKSSVHLNIGNSDYVIDKLLKHEIDIGTIEKPYKHPQIEVIPWKEDELSIFTSASHPLAEKQTVEPSDLEQYEWVMREIGAGSRRVLESELKENALKIKIAMELTLTEGIKNYVAGGRGISCLSRYVLGDMEVLGKIKLLSTPFLNLKRRFYVILHKDRFKTRLQEEFMELLGLY